MAVLGVASCLPHPGQVPDKLLLMLGGSLAGPLWAWLHVVGRSATEGRWVAPLQLYIDFQMATGLTGPVFDPVSNCWKDPNLRNLDSLRGFPFPQQLNWSARVLLIMLDLRGLSSKATLCRPDSSVIGHWCLSFPLMWIVHGHDTVDTWLQRNFPVGSTRRRAAGLQSGSPRWRWVCQLWVGLSEEVNLASPDVTIRLAKGHP